MADDRDILPEEDDYALLTDNEFDDALSALKESRLDDTEEENETKHTDNEVALNDAPDAEEEINIEDAELAGSKPDDEPETFEEDERLRGPRADRFRRRRQNRIAFLPLALYLLALGGFLIAREQEVEALPDLSTAVLIGSAVLMAAFTMIFHSLLSGRRERGLLISGLWIGVTAGGIAAWFYGIDDQLDAAEWWPVLLAALGLALFINYTIERTHDARLLWVGIICLVAAGVAYVFTSNTLDEEGFRNIVDYWPLLLSVVGIGVVPLIFRRHLE